MSVLFLLFTSQLFKPKQNFVSVPRPGLNGPLREAETEDKCLLNEGKDK